MAEKTPITDEWLSSVDFKWRQDARQPNKHWTLALNVDDGAGGMSNQTKIEVQRSGWVGRNGYVGDRESWMLWVTDFFDRTAFVGNIRCQEDITQLAEIITQRRWNPETHIYGQAWPEGAAVLNERWPNPEDEATR